MELKCKVQEYAWGKIGSNSEVAKLADKACDNFSLKPETPYAELWMGVHPNGPSMLAEGGESLASYLSGNPEALGPAVREKFSNQLPFLFKVLSVNKALSIQAHPNKEHAEKLHAERPDVYKDPNHKPEIAIALTDFQGLCGFRPLSEIQNFLKESPELCAAVGKDNADALLNTQAESDPASYSKQLKDCFAGLMSCDKAVLAEQLGTLKARIEGHPELMPELFCGLMGEFPGDVGCFVIYFLNLVKLCPGEAMYLGPNVPHAYLSGDCIECMANSDNVVRAGLTPKLIDVPTLVEMLEYRCGSADERKFAADSSGASADASSGGTIQMFNPPVPDFAVAHVTIEGDTNCFTLPVRQSASILLFTQGTGKYLASHQVTKEGGLTVVQPYASNDIAKGSVLFLPANKILEIFPEDCDRLVAFQAFATP